MLLRRFLELLRKIPPLKLDEVDLAVAAGPALAVTLGARVAVRAFACGAAYAARRDRASGCKEGEATKSARGSGAASAKHPIVAIGGINAENGAALITAGADMLAVINAMFADESVAQRTAKLVALFN